MFLATRLIISVSNCRKSSPRRTVMILNAYSDTVYRIDGYNNRIYLVQSVVGRTGGNNGCLSNVAYDVSRKGYWPYSP